MAEFTAATVQTVNNNDNVLFTETPMPGNYSIVHREGSGLVTLRGVTKGQCRARYKVSFGGNIAISGDGAQGEISLAIALNGEAINTTTMTVTPAAVENFFNVFSSVYIDVPVGCCSQVSVKNITDTPDINSVDVRNANFIVERIA